MIHKDPKIYIGYEDPIFLKTGSDFFDKTHHSGLSELAFEAFEFIQQIAAPNLTVTGFKNYYGQNFNGFVIVYLFDEKSKKKKKERMGFLLAGFSKIIDPNTNRVVHTIKCFPAFAPKFRNKENYKYDRGELYGKVIGYYLTHLLPTTKHNFTDLATKVVLGQIPTLRELWQIMGFTLLKNADFFVKINVESPSTFNDLKKFKFDNDLPEILPAHISEMTTWFEEGKKVKNKSLRNKIHLKNLENAMNKIGEAKNFIDKIIEAKDIVVNIDEEEKLKHRKKAIETGNVNRLFFIWQNPLYPKYTFETTIPITLRGILTYIKNRNAVGKDYRINPETGRVHTKKRNLLATFLKKLKETLLS